MNATWPLHGEAHGTHCSRSFCDVSRRPVGVPTLQVLQDVLTRLERGGGGGGADREQRGRNEGGREKCASLNTHNIETTMCVNDGTSNKNVKGGSLSSQRKQPEL